MSKYRELLKEATKLKRAKEYDKACEKLREAYSFRNGEYWTIAESLRLPAYLQLAGRQREALDEFDRLLSDNKYAEQPESFIKSVDGLAGSLRLSIDFKLNTGNLSAIHGCISDFYKNEGDVAKQLIHHCFSHVLDVIYKIEIIQSMHRMADEYALEAERLDGDNQYLREAREKLESARDKRLPPHAFTDKGNPVRDVSYPHLKRSILDNVNTKHISDEIITLDTENILGGEKPGELANLIVEIIDRANIRSDEWMQRIKDMIEKGR